jgi:hypothetical protein
MKRLLVVLLLVFVLVACNPKGATNVLEIEGYTDIEITGYDFLSCSDSDIFSTGFIATNPQGVRIRGVVCESIFKAKTIRLHGKVKD